MGSKHLLGRTARMGAILMLVIGTLVSAAPAASAAHKTCWVTNTTMSASYSGKGANLQTAIDAAGPGDTLQVKGRCSGTFAISEDLTLIGKSKKHYKVATLDGASSGTVLTIDAATVRITDLRITHGSVSCFVPDCGGGGITNYYGSGTITMAGSTSVRGNEVTCEIPLLACGGGGILNHGTITMNKASSVSKNSVTSVFSSGGGILNVGGTITMNASSSVSGNSAGGGGAMYNQVGTVTMGGSSSLAGNTALDAGGGIWNQGGTLTMGGSSSVAGNSATTQGGGIMVDGATTMGDHSSISANTAPLGGGVYLDASTFTMNDNASIVSNIATSSGGGLFKNTGTFVFNGGSVEDNTPDNFAP